MKRVERRACSNRTVRLEAEGGRLGNQKTEGRERPDDLSTPFKYSCSSFFSPGWVNEVSAQLSLHASSRFPNQPLSTHPRPSHITSMDVVPGVHSPQKRCFPSNPRYTQLPPFFDSRNLSSCLCLLLPFLPTFCVHFCLQLPPHLSSLTSFPPHHPPTPYFSNVLCSALYALSLTPLMRIKPWASMGS